jgi:2-deoxy-D-gluconate 3-dehydrogenase
MTMRALGDLEGKVAVVTGGGKGIGRAIALAFAGAGADVAVVGRDEDALHEVAGGVRDAGRRGLVLASSITSPAALPALFDRVADELGPLDILVNNAGQQHTAPAEDLTEEQWDATMDCNLKALFFCAQEAGRRYLARGTGGRIINIASTYSLVAFPGFAAYCASKGGVLQLTRALATEWARHGINVNAIGPTAVYTDMMREMLDDPAFRESYLPRVPSGEFPQPEDVAAAALFLAGPGSRFIHGHQLMVDGGYTAM